MAEKRFSPGRKAKRPQKYRSPTPYQKAEETEIRIFGMHAVEAALNNQARVVHSAKMTANAARKLDVILKKRAIEPDEVSPRELDRILGSDTVHQGALIVCDPLPEPSLEDLVAATAQGRPIIVLDQVTDPHNVGAILRSGAVFRCAGLLMTRRHSPPLNGVLAKSASGGLEHVPIHLVTNLTRAIEELKQLGVHTIGLEGSSDVALHSGLPTNSPTAIVLGAEGKGLRQLTAETCNQLCRIETTGALTSLNVSNAAAIALHLIAMQRH